MPTPPRPEDVRRRLPWVTVVPLGLAGGLLGAVAIAPILMLRNTGVGRPVPSWELVAYGLVTAAMTMAALGLALRRRRAGPSTAALCMIFGWLNCPACLLVWGLGGAFEGGSLSLPVAMIAIVPVGLLIGLFIALPIGFFYGIVLAGPMARIAALRARPTLDAIPRATRLVSFVIFPSALFGAFVARISESSADASVPAWAPLALAGAALIVFTRAHLRIRGHRTWLERVAAGEVPHWALIPNIGAALPELVALAPESESTRAGSILVYVPEASPTYRTASDRVLWAMSEASGNDPDDVGV